MLWQDWIIAIGGFCFSIALIPSIRGKDKPPASTSVLTAFFLYVFAICFATLGMWLSMSSEILSGIAWTILLIQKVKLNGIRCSNDG